jgi:hypothetical protein
VKWTPRILKFEKLPDSWAWFFQAPQTLANFSVVSGLFCLRVEDASPLLERPPTHAQLVRQIVLPSSLQRALPSVHSGLPSLAAVAAGMSTTVGGIADP